MAWVSDHPDDDARIEAYGTVDELNAAGNAIYQDMKHGEDGPRRVLLLKQRDELGGVRLDLPG